MLTMRNVFCIAAVLLAGYANADTSTSAPSSSTQKCKNGGYSDTSGDNICICPPGYLGVYCESVKNAIAPDNSFQTSSSFNIMNFNVWTQFWGAKTYSNIKKAVEEHQNNYVYGSYWKFQTDGKPQLDNFEHEDDSSFEQGPEMLLQNPGKFKLNSAGEAGLYWCYPVKIYENIVNFVKQAKLKNSVITIITQHPPSDESFEEAREITASFGVKLNVLWVSDVTFNWCVGDALDKIAKFQTLVENTGGLFVQLQAKEDDANTQLLVSRILMTHLNVQVVAMETRHDCSSLQKINFALDSNIQNPYYFTFSGANATTSSATYVGCQLQIVANSYDRKIINFESVAPPCTSFEIQTSEGPCTAMVYTYDNASPRVGVDVYVTYVEDKSIDASRYAIIEEVPFYPAIHIEPGNNKTTDIIVTQITLKSESNDLSLGAERRNKSAYEWTTQTKVTCNSNSGEQLFIELEVNSVMIQRVVRVNCLSTPPLETVAPTTTAFPTTTAEVGSSSPASQSTNSAGTTTITSTVATTSTFAPTSTAAATDGGTSTAFSIGTTSESCKRDPSETTFLFAYSTEMVLTTYNLARQEILKTVDRSLADYSIVASVRTDAVDDLKILNETDTISFASDLKVYAPDQTKALPSVQGSNFIQAIKQFLGNSEINKENSIIILLVNRLPKSNEDLSVSEYNKLTNTNNKIFSIISQTALINQIDFINTGSRSGSVLNKIAALSNGHYIVANDTTENYSSDYSQIVRNIMQFGYNQDLLYSRNLAGDRLNQKLGTIRIPSATTVNVNLTITISLFASDSSLPKLPERLFLAFKATENDPVISIDFVRDQSTQFSSSNFFIATVLLKSGVDREMILMYQSADGQTDLLLRIWTDKTDSHSARFVDFEGASTTPDDVIGASMQFTIKNSCQNQTSEIVITDCNGDISTKYDAKQTANALPLVGEQKYQQFNFVPFFCDAATLSNCIAGAENKYDIQLVSDGYSITRSFLCGKSEIPPTANCKKQDSLGNYRCSGASAPFKRGPTGVLNDCSGHGNLFFNSNSSETNYSDMFECACESDRFSGVSCQEVTCDSKSDDPLALDNSYHTYTVVLGIDGGNGFDLVSGDAKTQNFDLQSITPPLTNIWKYQLLVMCQDNHVESLYSGSSLKEFQAAFNNPLSMDCEVNTAVGAVDLTNVYAEAVRGVGKNVRGMIVYFTESPSALNVTLDNFIAASQTYQQQFFIITGEETGSPKALQNRDVSNAAMSTGGFLIQSVIDANGNFQLFNNFIPDLLSGSSSIAFSGIQLASNTFSVFFEAKTYLLTWNRGGTINLNGEPSDECKVTQDVSAMCQINNKNQLLTVTSASGTANYDAIVYVINDPVAAKARIISDLQKDVNDAVSTTSSATRSIFSFSIPSDYKIVANSDDDGSTRTATRSSCQYPYISYSVFSDSKYEKGANFAQITIQKGSEPQITRYFAFGTTDQAVCINGGTAIQATGSCQCPDGFTGADCSLVDCSINPGAVSNTWSDVCYCTHIDDATCAKAYTSSMYF